MASFLDGMPGSIYAGFKGKLRTGVIRRLAGGNGTDSHGRPQGQAPTLHKLEGFQDDYSDFTRANSGIPANAVRLNIFSASIKPTLAPTKDMLVRLDYPAANGLPARSQWFKLLGADTDPATALWVCPAFKVEAPGNGG